MKKELILLSFICLVTIIILLPVSCTFDELPQQENPAICDTLRVTYDLHLKDIIDSNCAYIGCHDGGGTNGAVGDYSSYGGLEPFLGTMKGRVVTLRSNPSLGMPPDRSVYSESQKDDLTGEELDIFICWINSNFPEN